MQRIRQSMVRAREQAELAWLLGAIEQDAAVSRRDDSVFLSLHDQNVAGAAGRLHSMTLTHLGDERGSRRCDVIGLGVRQLREAGRCVPRDNGDTTAALRGDPEGHEAAQARAEQAEAAVECLVPRQMIEHGLEIGHARGHGGVAVEPAGLAAAAEIEARQGQAPLRKIPAEQEVLVAVLAGAHAVAGDHARGGPSFREMQHADDQRALHLNAEALSLHDHGRSNSSQVLAEIWVIVSSTTRSLIPATYSASRWTTCAPDGSPPSTPC